MTLVGQEILRGRHISVGGVTPRDWLHFIVSLLCHDMDTFAVSAVAMVTANMSSMQPAIR